MRSGRVMRWGGDHERRHPSVLILEHSTMLLLLLPYDSATTVLQYVLNKCRRDHHNTVATDCAQLAPAKRKAGIAKQDCTHYIAVVVFFVAAV